MSHSAAGIGQTDVFLRLGDVLLLRRFGVTRFDENRKPHDFADNGNRRRAGPWRKNTWEKDDVRMVASNGRHPDVQLLAGQ